MEGVARDALANLLRESGGVTAVRQVATHEELGRVLRQAETDVLIIDDRLVENGRHLLAGLGPMRAAPRVFVIGVDDHPAFSARAHRLGAEAWVAKDRADEDLLPLLGR